MNRPPTFTELVDWVDGRLDEPRAADVSERAASGGPETEDALAWIHEFKAAAALMPLANPPERVRASLRASFRQLRAPWAGAADELSLDFDSRLAPVAGVRSTATLSGPFHLDFSSAGFRVSLDVSPLVGDEVLVNGALSSDGVLGTDLGIVFTSDGQPRRTTTADRSGRFSTQVPTDIDEIWIVSATHRGRASLNLTGAP